MINHGIVPESDSPFVPVVASSFPVPEDWAGWIDLWCRDDTGNISCVPECLRHHVHDLVTPEGWLKRPDLMPNTPYKIARWFQFGNGPVPPWSGSGMSPTAVRQMWEERIAAEVEEADEQEACTTDLYFIGAKEGPIKIGIAMNPAKRLKQLQTAYPHKLEILAILPGGARQECAYHARFAAHRLHGEWFTRCPEIESEIARLGGGE